MRGEVRGQVGVQTFAVDDWTVGRLAESKGDRTISMCIPCRDEVATIGPIVAATRQHLIERAQVLDELIVLDDRSTDDTATVAADAGARVVPMSAQRLPGVRFRLVVHDAIPIADTGDKTGDNFKEVWHIAKP